jgi:Undecaprenyl-phosphate glucose phosphotransferase
MNKVNKLDNQRLKNIQQIVLLAVDTLMIVVAFVLGYYARGADLSYFERLTEIDLLERLSISLPQSPESQPPFSRYYVVLLIHTATILVFFYFTRMYHMKRAINRIDVGYYIAQNVSMGTFMAIAIETLALKNSTLALDYPRGMIVYAWIFSIILVSIGRELHRQVVVRLRKSGIGRDRVLVVGTDTTGLAIANLIYRSPQFGYEMIGLVAGENQGEPEYKVQPFKPPMLGYCADLPRLIDENHVDEVIVALPEATRAELLNVITLCQRGNVEIKIFPDTLAFVTGSITVDALGGLPLLNVRDIALRGWKLSLKRSLDIVGAIFGLIILSPLLMTLSAIIYFTDRGPIFFAQERVGLDGRPFPMIKFRTMRVDAEKLGSWTVRNDPRVTRIGALLRRTNLDELPNLVNVLYGQMSLVGPRPEQVKFVEEFKKSIPRYMERHREKSGMTGWAQVNGYRGDTSIEERLKYDLYYVENWSLWFDIKIILRTITQTVFMRNKNAY